MDAEAGVRPFRDEDAPAAAALLGDLVPEWLVTAALLVHWIRNSPERAQTRFWIGERAGDVAGLGYAELDWTAAEPGIARLWVGVRENARRQGLGSRLYELAESHVLASGGRKLRGSAGADPAGQRFLERRGFTRTRSERMSQLDPRDADLSELPRLEAEKAAEGFRVVPLRHLLDRPRELHALYREGEMDMPADDERGNLPYDEWERETLANPLLDRDASINVVAAGRPVSLAWLLVDREGGRAVHELTATLRAYRGRGLARLAKLAAIRWCIGHDVHTLLTGNDAENAAMLAINDRLGYRPTLVRTELAKELEQRPDGER